MGKAYEKDLCSERDRIFYGNPAGYLGDGKAVIDCMFQKEELVSFVKELGFLEHVFREGVYDRLSEGGGVKETAETSIGEGRRLRIYQLGQDSPIMSGLSVWQREKREGMTDRAGRNMSESMRGR